MTLFLMWRPELRRVQGSHTPTTLSSWRRVPCEVHGSHELYIVRGAPGPARTDDLRIRSPTLYPTELRALWGE
jgi:hypothetical protein